MYMFRTSPSGCFASCYAPLWLCFSIMLVSSLLTYLEILSKSSRMLVPFLKLSRAHVHDPKAEKKFNIYAIVGLANTLYKSYMDSSYCKCQIAEQGLRGTGRFH